MNFPEDSEDAACVPGAGAAHVVRELPMVLTVREVAEVLRIGRNQAYELVRHGDLAAIRCGKTWRVSRQALVAFLEARHD